jgi:hypothetical protein
MSHFSLLLFGNAAHEKIVESLMVLGFEFEVCRQAVETTRGRSFPVRTTLSPISLTHPIARKIHFQWLNCLLID